MFKHNNNSLQGKEAKGVGEQKAEYAELVDQLKQVNSKLDRLLGFFETMTLSNKNSVSPQADIMTLLGLPDYLRTTALALLDTKEATASEIAKETGRLRSYESLSANELVRLGFVKKRRQNRVVYFYIEPEGLKKIE
jgi:predicted transcriptional regulator